MLLFILSFHPFFSMQLSDIFSYEIPFYTPNSQPHPLTNPQSTCFDQRTNNNHPQCTANVGSSDLTALTVYNFHSLLYQSRLLFFITSSSTSLSPNNTSLQAYNKLCSLSSITELFFSANWLEREVSELHGVLFTNKQDLRNLMLQYGDSSIPFQKSFPSIGYKELTYNPIKDTLTQNLLSLQL